MAIKKKGNTGFLHGTTVEKFDNIVPVQSKDPILTKTTGQSETPQKKAEVPQSSTQPSTTPEATQDFIRQVAQELIQQGAIHGITSLEPHGGPHKFGRPRQELIKGIREVSVNLQLPENLVQALRAKARIEKKSMKELIGRAVMNAYPECWANS